MKLPVSIAVVGVSFYQDEVCQLLPGTPLVLRREPSNAFDNFAIVVLRQDTGARLGYIPKTVTEKLLQLGNSFTGYVADIRAIAAWGFDVVVTAAVTADPWESGAQWEAPGYAATSNPPQKIQNENLTTDCKSDEEAKLVRARSGRVLGRFVKNEFGRVEVLTDTGINTAYPEELVVIN